MCMFRSFCNTSIRTVQDDEWIKDEHLEKVNPQQTFTFLELIKMLHLDK